MKRNELTVISGGEDNLYNKYEKEETNFVNKFLEENKFIVINNLNPFPNYKSIIEKISQ